MTQRLSTKIGVEGGLETNVESGGSRGFQVADNVIYKPVGGFSKISGSKKLSEGKENFNRNMIAAAQSRNDSIISLVENDLGAVSVLGYNTEGVRVNLYSMANSQRVVIQSDGTLNNTTKIRFEFDNSVFQLNSDFIDKSFPNKLSVFNGYFQTYNSFTTIAAQQDGHQNRLILPPLFNAPIFTGPTVNPTYQFEVTVTGSSSFSTPPTNGNYSIVSVSDTQIIIEKTGDLGSVMSGVGTVNFNFIRFKYILIEDICLQTSSLIDTQTKVFFESEGKVPVQFKTDQIQTIQPTTLDDQIVFPFNAGQAYVSDENHSTPVISHYGVPQGIDVIAYSIDPVISAISLGIADNNCIFAYRCLFKKKIGDRELVGSPSPIFYHRTQYSALIHEPFTQSSEGITFTNLIFEQPNDTGKNVKFFYANVKFNNTPSPADEFHDYKIHFTYNRAFLKREDIVAVLGFTFAGNGTADIYLCASVACSIAVPFEIYEDYQRIPLIEYSVELYRSPSKLSTLGEAPDTSNFYLVKEQKVYPGSPLAVVWDDTIHDKDLLSQRPLYTNILQEGELKANDLCPQYQVGIEKQGTFFAASIQKQPLIQGDLIFGRETGLHEWGPTVEFGVTEFNMMTGTSFSGGSQYRSMPYFTVTFTSEFYDKGVVSFYELFAHTYFNRTSTTDTTTPIGYLINMRNGTIVLVKAGAFISAGAQRELLSFFDYGVLNPTYINGSCICFFVPVFAQNNTSVSQAKITLPRFDLQTLFQNFFGFTSSVSHSFFQYHVYSMLYRPLNLAPREIPSWLIATYPGVSTTSWRCRSNYNFYLYDTSYQNYPNGSYISGNFVLKRRNSEPIFIDFPPMDFNYRIQQSFLLENYKNQIVYSKPFEPQAFPPLNFLTVGSDSNEILKIFAIRDSIVIASTEGFFRLTGVIEEDFALSQIENEAIPLSRLLMAEQNDIVYAVTNKGLAACTESNVSIVDTAVQDIFEQFLALYKNDLKTLTPQTCQTVVDDLNSIITFFLPSLHTKDLTKSSFGLTLDSNTRFFSTVDLYRQDANKSNVLLAYYDDKMRSRFFYQTPSLEPSSLYQRNKTINRSDFVEKQTLVLVDQSWTGTGTLSSGSTTLRIDCVSNHHLENGDLIKIVNSFYTAMNLTETFSVTVISDTAFTVSLPNPAPSDSAPFELQFRLGRLGFVGNFTSVLGSDTLTLTFLRSFNGDTFPVITGTKIIIQKPWPTELTNALENESDLEGLREILTVSDIGDTVTMTIQLSSPAIGSATGSIDFSFESKPQFYQAFSITSPLSEDEFAVVMPVSNQLLYPYSFSKLNNNIIQGFFEKPLDSQYKLDQNGYLYLGTPITIMTSRITGGDPCSLKNFDQLIVAFQNFFSCTKGQISFQGDRFSAASGVVWKAQETLTGSFDPAFGDTVWSSIFQQWSTLSSPTTGWRESTPFVPLRITVPSEVAQSTYITVFMRHSRPFESMSVGAVAINGTFIDPTGARV